MVLSTSFVYPKKEWFFVGAEVDRRDVVTTIIASVVNAYEIRRSKRVLDGLRKCQGVVRRRDRQAEMHATRPHAIILVQQVQVLHTTVTPVVVKHVGLVLKAETRSLKVFVTR